MRSMASTSRVTWLHRTSATLHGTLTVGSGRHGPLGTHQPPSGSIGYAQAYPIWARPEPSLHLVGLRRSLVSVPSADTPGRRRRSRRRSTPGRRETLADRAATESPP